MIRLISPYWTLAKSACHFIGFPMCKISHFSQEIQDFAIYFSFSKKIHFYLFQKVKDLCNLLRNQFSMFPNNQRPLSFVPHGAI